MRLVVVSDVHLEFLDGDERRALLSFIDETSDRDHLVFAGDLFDAPPDRGRRAFPENTEFLRRVAERVARGARVTYVVGNHDIAISALTMAVDHPPFEVAYPRWRGAGAFRGVVVEHGHAYDPFYRSHLYEAMRLVEDVTGVDPGEAVVDVLERLAAVLRLPQRAGLGVPRAALGLWRAAAEGLIAAGARVVVMGHTHEPELRTFGGGAYVNAGSWLGNRSYVAIEDTARGLVIELRGWGREGPVARHVVEW